MEADAFLAGYAGEDPPFPESVEPDEMAENVAWAQGVWQRQAEQMAELAKEKP